MNDKIQAISMLRDEFDRWKDLLAGMSEEQINDPQPSSDLSIKDIVAHLWAWQQISVARVEAALHNTEPQNPWRHQQPDLDPDANVDRINAWIYETNRDKSWPDVYEEWHAQFLHFLSIAEQVPEQDLIAPGRYAWLGEYALADVLSGSYEHHEEHRAELLARLPQHDT
ncbi:MAG: ClbS/DfsB family four-helix bundle protein [Chloroflexota bacterium]